ncbi:FGGY-family carbohydrate kinase [Cryptosporangium arvum]|uniref:FGGY-family carbohydrate kinase n=1 Tax=Cryptosporangium arvum TaxID=80871 RepID=UPI0004B05964|nr:FGGY family carbohydrate kinase [Cryptosporangium arvum]
MLVVGIDKGTSVTKTAVFDENGTQVVSASRRVRQFHDGPGWHEEDPEDTWARTAGTVAECMAALGARTADVVGVGVTGHMGGAWFVDAAGRSVRRAIAWPDTRANDVVARLENGPDLDEFLRITENGALPGMTVPVLAHLGPELVDQVHAVLNAKDFVGLRLTGRMASEPSDAAFVPSDIDRGTHSARVLEILGAPEWSGKFPELIPSGSVLGEVTPGAAELTGLPAGTPVVAGLGDAPAAMVGCGAVTPGSAVSILGTSWLSATVVTDPHGGRRGIGWMYPMPNGAFAHFVAQQAGSSTFDWWLRHLAPEVSGTRDFAALEAEVLAVGEAATNLTFLPYFSAAGTQAPFKAPNLRGTLLGLEDATGRADIFRAVYEGLAYAMADCYSAFGRTAETIRLTGGGAASAIWPGVLSNIMGVPVELLAADEGAALGVAVLAGVSAGVWPTLEAAEKSVVRVVRRIEPDAELHRAHQRQFARFTAAQRMTRAFYDDHRGTA